MPTNNNKALVSTGKPKIGGAVYCADNLAAASLPVTADEALDASFKCLGFVSTDGVKKTPGGEAEEFKAWGGDTVAIGEKSYSDKYAITFIEALNKDLLKIIHGAANVSGDLATGLSVVSNGRYGNMRRSYVVDMELHGNVKARFVIPDGVVTERGDVTYKDDELISYPLTIAAMPDDNENTHYEYYKGAASA